MARSSKTSTSSAPFLQQTTSVCDLGSTPTADTASTMGKTGRKTFKTDKKKEAVWPDYIERWLLQAIEEYAPPQSRSGRGKPELVRFPRRNKYISEFIFENTGKYRSAKQVGSRIQQLRQTCRDPKIRRAIVDLKRFSDPLDASDDEGSTSADPELTMQLYNPSSCSGSSTRSSTLISEISSRISSPVTPLLTPHVLISHRISLHILLSGHDWIHRAPQATHLYVQLPSQPLQGDEKAVKETYASYSISSTHLLDSPTFIVIPDGLDYSNVYMTTFELYTEDNARLCYSPLSLLSSHEAPQLSAVIPKHIWTSLVEYSHSNCYLIQTIQSHSGEPIMAIKYNVAVLDSRSSLPPSPLPSYEAATVSSPGLHLNLDSSALFQPELPLVAAPFSPVQHYTEPSDLAGYSEPSWGPSSSTMPYATQYL
ncbi:hypothetical protein BKA70DRAFT_1520995 [Coprinopsis sp. MPI-PUGE-AT-0042]|nr:hypothetical protein BKA70DRAFT_1520995 [Coprinopsis sp. MPI-PUGE-AT-0042]